jgi:hypothetical protein
VKIRKEKEGGDDKTKHTKQNVLRREKERALSYDF